jgi:hypothetical protein
MPGGQVAPSQARGESLSLVEHANELHNQLDQREQTCQGRSPGEHLFHLRLAALFGNLTTRFIHHYPPTGLLPCGRLLLVDSDDFPYNTLTRYRRNTPNQTGRV